MFIGSEKRKIRLGSPKELFLLLSVSVTLDPFHSLTAKWP